MLHRIINAIDTPGTIHSKIVNIDWNIIKIIQPYQEFLNDSKRWELNRNPSSNDITLNADNIKIDMPADANKTPNIINAFIRIFFLVIYSPSNRIVIY